MDNRPSHMIVDIIDFFFAFDIPVYTDPKVVRLKFEPALRDSWQYDSVASISDRALQPELEPDVPFLLWEFWSVPPANSGAKIGGVHPHIARIRYRILDDFIALLFIKAHHPERAIEVVGRWRFTHFHLSLPSGTNKR